MDYYGINLEINEGIALLTFSRPESLNVLNTQLITSFNQTLKELSQHKKLRALIITGQGKSFIAGADIKELSQLRPAEAYNFSRKGQIAFERLETLDFPVIAAINGYALGGGCELAMACDIRIASVNARFGMPETRLGLMPGFAGTQRLCRLIGYGNAMYLMTTSETITAEEAMRLGLLQIITESDALHETALGVAKKIASNGLYAVRSVKELARKSLVASFNIGSELESEAFASLFGRNEAIEGMSAFMEKRAPQWEDS